jgi:hypothetical protein
MQSTLPLPEGSAYSRARTERHASGPVGGYREVFRPIERRWSLRRHLRESGARARSENSLVLRSAPGSAADPLGKLSIAVASVAAVGAHVVGTKRH